MFEIKIEAKIHVYTQSELSDVEKMLLEEAKSAAERAYARYSGFQVGAAALLSNGVVATGNNQENAAYPSGLCAERTCLFHAHSLYPTAAIEALVIVAKQNGRFLPTYVPPCGACRQVLKESEERQDRPIRLLMAGEEEVYVASSIADLLPLSFNLPE